MASMNSPDGTDSPPNSPSAYKQLTPISPDLAHNFFDFTSDNFVETDHSTSDFSAPNFHDDNTSDHTLDFASPMFAPINDVPVAPTTVSPKDLLVDSMSAPPSSAMTNLSTPGTNYYMSPHMVNSTDPSPMFEDDHLEPGEEWSNLFQIEPDTDPKPASAFAATDNNNTMTIHPSIEVMAPPQMSRNQSSPGQSSTGTPHHRHSSIAGVGRKRRDKPLPEINIPDQNDIVALKRARNTAAARKSRAKKVANMEEMAVRIQDLERERDEWKALALQRNGGGM